MKGDLRALFVELICMLLNTSTSDKNFIQTTAKELSFGIISDIISNNCQMIVKFDADQCLVKYEMSAVFCSDFGDLNIGDQVICLKNGHWKVIPVKHWDKLSNTGFGYSDVTPWVVNVIQDDNKVRKFAISLEKNCWEYIICLPKFEG